MRRPERPLSMMVAMYLRSVEKVRRSMIFAPSRSCSYDTPRPRIHSSSAPSVGLPMILPSASRKAVELRAISSSKACSGNSS